MIREEHKNAFLDEKTKKIAFIRFTDDNEIIDASQIVDQGSFKYTESANDGNEIKLGYSESASFEIDIKGDLVNRSGQEIYVEIQAEENENIYSLPIGFFVISDIDYDYTLDKSHILAYSKDFSINSPIVKPPKVDAAGFGMLLNNYYLNMMSDGLIPKEYIYETETTQLNKTIGDIYYSRQTYWTFEWVSGSTYRYYVSESLNLFRVCYYGFDEKYSRKIYPYKNIFYLHMSDKNIQVYYNNDLSYLGAEALEQFWNKNPKYNPNNYGTDKRESIYTKTPSDAYRFYEGLSGNTIRNYYQDYPSTDYKVSRQIASYSDFGERDLKSYAMYYIKSGYRTATYTSTSYDYKTVFDYENFNDVVWSGIANEPTLNDLNDVNVRYLVSNQYGMISEFGGSALSETTEFQIAVDLAQANGNMIKVNREDGGLTEYSLDSFSGTFPSDDIYPNEEIYPSGDKNIVKITKDMYSLLISKTKQSKKVGKVVVKKTDVEYVAQVEDFNEKTYSTITLENNNFINNNYIDAQLVADSILDKYKNNIFTPFELECTGLPWLEAGDWIIVETDDGQQRLNVNRRTLSGIQGMMDSLSAGGI